MKTYIFDIDGTICKNTYGNYKEAQPFEERILFINDLYKKGNIIKYFTARGSTTGIDWYELTKKQLIEWEALHHELILGKPDGDIYIDDKAFNSEKWIFPKKTTNLSSDLTSENSFLRISISDHIKTLEQILQNEIISNQIIDISSKVKKSIENNGKIIFAGNGGSFADAQHLSAEFVSKLNSDRLPLPSVTLGTNSSNLTAIGNDYGFQIIFSRELEAIGQQQDFIIALSTSGNSENIINLIKRAEVLNIPFFILSGKTGGKLSKYKNSILKVPSSNTAIIQQVHILLGHIICRNAELPYL